MEAIFFFFLPPVLRFFSFDLLGPSLRIWNSLLEERRGDNLEDDDGVSFFLEMVQNRRSLLLLFFLKENSSKIEFSFRDTLCS